MAVKKQTSYREKTKYKGLYTRISKNTINPRDGKPDVIYDMAVKLDGKVKWLKLGSKSEGLTLETALDKQLKMKMEMKYGNAMPDEYVKKSKYTFDEARAIVKERHLNNLARPEDEEYRYARYIKPEISGLVMQSITTFTIEGLKQAWLNQNLSAATIRLLLADIRIVYNKMILWGLYNGTNPIKQIEMPKLDNERVRYLTREEADRLMADLKIRSKFGWRIAMISLHSGLRLGEIYKLRKNEINFGTNTIYVRDAKTGSRKAKFDSSITGLLMEVVEETPDSTGLLFPSVYGTVRKSNMGSKVYFSAVERLGFNVGVDDARYKVVFHTLRHTFASWLAISGVPLYTIQRLMGHKSIRQTERYAHLCPGVMGDAANLIGKFTDHRNAV